MRPLLRPFVLFLVLGSSLSLYAESAPASNPGANVSNDQAAFLAGGGQASNSVGTWTPSVIIPGANACSYPDNANGVNAAELMNSPDALSLQSQTGPDGVVRNNLPEPSTWLLMVGSVPLIWRRVKRLA